MLRTKIETSFCLILALTIWVAPSQRTAGQDGAWGNLKGKITVDGELPEIPREVVDKDQATCLRDGEAPLDDNLVVDDKSKGLRDAFVMMYLKRGAEKPPVHPAYDAALQKPVVIDNKNCRFHPHASFARTGQTVRLKNSDDVGHNCHIVLFNSEINLNLPIGEHVDVEFDKVEKFPGQVKCDMHFWMDGVLLVRDEPYVAITDKDGNFEIKNIPAGKWQFQFWHKKAGYMKYLKIPGMKPGRRGEIEIEIKQGETLDLGGMTFPAKKFKD